MRLFFFLFLITSLSLSSSSLAENSSFCLSKKIGSLLYRGSSKTKRIQEWISSWKEHHSILKTPDNVNLDWLENALSDALASKDFEIRQRAETIYKKLVSIRARASIKAPLTAEKQDLADNAAMLFNDLHPFEHQGPIRGKNGSTSLQSTLDLVRHQKLEDFYLYTDVDLSVRDLNDLSIYPFYPVGMISKTEYADGFRESAAGFMSHDLFHGVLKYKTDKELITAIKEHNWVKVDQIIREREQIYREFRQIVDNSKSNTQKELLDLLWFYFFHESSKNRIERASFENPLDLFEDEQGVASRSIFFLRLFRSNDLASNLSWRTKALTTVRQKDVDEALKLFKELAHPKSN